MKQAVDVNTMYLKGTPALEGAVRPFSGSRRSSALGRIRIGPTHYLYMALWELTTWAMEAVKVVSAASELTC